MEPAKTAVLHMTAKEKILLRADGTHYNIKELTRLKGT
jgi:hypothetical protein